MSANTKTNTTPAPLWKRVIDICCCLLALPFLCVLTVFMFVFVRL